MAASKAARFQKQLETLVNKFVQSEKDFIEQTNIELSLLESKVLSFIGENDSCIMKEISTYLAIPKNNLTVIVDKLESKKLVKRSHSEKDRRAISLKLTAKGESLFEERSQYLLEVSKDLLKALKSTEQNQLLFALEKISEKYS
jgi:DNA-binding MarR family transcriptional regulator